MEKAKQYELGSTAENELREFERRQILTYKENKYKCKVNFFEEWLKEKGITEIITKFSDEDAILTLREQEGKAYVQSDEIVKLVNVWGAYKGRNITEDRVRSWLRQFGDNSSQRLMFRILQNIKFYTADNIREK